PIALIIWLVRWIKGNTHRKNYY
ncbi:hypothetical protein BXA48_10085, partial [Enterococcus faecium]